MKTTLVIALLAVFSISFTANYHATPSTEDLTQDKPADKAHMFVGADKCKPCHMAAKKGAQYKVWKDTKHAKAFETLATDKAKEIAAKKGITGNPQDAPQCAKCHVTGFGTDAALLGEKYNKADGVTCESCHGAGGDYWAKETMADIFAKKIEPATVGLTLKPDEATCKKCHNEESPSFTAFNFEEMAKKIAHPMPKP